MITLPLSLTFLLLPLVLSSPTHLPRSNSLYSCLQSHNLLPITSSSSDYQSNIAAYNQRLQPEPYALIIPNTEQEVADAVACARDEGFRVAARGGGHSYASYGLGEDNGLVISLSSFNSIKVDTSNPDSITAKIGGGSRLGDVALALNEKGRAVSHGTCAFVGVGGHIGFGGFGLPSRMWGLSLDNVIGFDVVLANSTIIYNLTPEIDSDLFWALRGSSANYGIVTAFHIKTYSAPPSAINFAFSWNGLSVQDSTSIFLAYQNFGLKNAPSTLGISIVLGSGGSVTINGVSYSTEVEFRNTIQPLFEGLVGGWNEDVKTFTWIESVAALAGGQALNTTGVSDNRDDFFAKSLTTPMATPLTQEALTAYFNYIQNTQTDTNWFVEVNLYGGANSAINAVSLDETSFAHRDSLLNFQMYASSSNYGQPYSSNGIEFVTGMWHALVDPMLPLWGSNFGAYVNYVDPTLTFEEVKAYYWASQYDRLSELRARYDPGQVFRNPQSIRLPGDMGAKKININLIDLVNSELKS